LSTLVTSQACVDPEDPDWLRCLVAADAYAKYLAAAGVDAHSAAGLEAYTSKIAADAAVRGVDPKQQLGVRRHVFAKVLEALNCSPDVLGDSYDPKHSETLNRVFSELKAAGRLAKREVEVAVCLDDGPLYDEVTGVCPTCGSRVNGLGCCAVCGTPLVPSGIKDPVCGICDAPLTFKKTTEWTYEANDGHVDSGNIVLEVTRDTTWGIPVLEEANKGFASWLSSAALSVTSTMRIGSSGSWRPSRGLHFVTTRFGVHHSKLLPEILGAMGLTPETHRVLVVQHTRFTDGPSELVVASSKLLEHLGPDYARYALTRTNPEAKLTIDVRDLQRRINGELVDTLSQFTVRVLQFAQSKFGSVPAPHTLMQEDLDLINGIRKTVGQVVSSVNALDYSSAYDAIINFARNAAAYYTRQAPWSLLRVNPERAATVVYVALEAVRAIAALCYGFLPEFSSSVLRGLGSPDAKPTIAQLEHPLVAGTPISEPKPVYAKLSDKQIDALVSACTTQEKPQLDIAEFLRLDLRVATVVHAERVPNTKRLLKLRVRVANRLRTIVSSIGEQYAPEDLLGKKIVVLMNLKPSVFAGIASRGMLLAAEQGQTISLLTPLREIEDGAWVH
jgi:methionyl-tRNA synthetase